MLANSCLHTWEVGNVIRHAGSFALGEIQTLARSELTLLYIAECADKLFEPVWNDRPDSKRYLSIGALLSSVWTSMHEQYKPQEAVGIDRSGQTFKVTEALGDITKVDIAVAFWQKHLASAYRELYNKR